MMDEKRDVAVLTVNQDYMDASNAAVVKQDILRQLDGRTQAILDLSRVMFVDSAGLSGLLACLQQVAQAGGDLKLCGITDEVRVLFDLIHLQRLFEIFDNSEQAVLAFEG